MLPSVRKVFAFSLGVFDDFAMHFTALSKPAIGYPLAMAADSATVSVGFSQQGPTSPL